jgi:hypothetical protein
MAFRYSFSPAKSERAFLGATKIIGFAAAKAGVVKVYLPCVVIIAEDKGHS